MLIRAGVVSADSRHCRVKRTWRNGLYKFLTVKPSSTQEKTEETYAKLINTNMYILQSL